MTSHAYVICVPMDRWMPLHSIQIRMPKLHDAHSGSESRRGAKKKNHEKNFPGKFQRRCSFFLSLQCPSSSSYLFQNNSFFPLTSLRSSSSLSRFCEKLLSSFFLYFPFSLLFSPFVLQSAQRQFAASIVRSSSYRRRCSARCSSAVRPPTSLEGNS